MTGERVRNLSKLFAFITVYFFIFSVTAQPTLDTINDCLKQKPQVFAKFDTRNSFISNARAKILGIKTGLNFGKRLQFGIGYNQLSPSSNSFDKKIFFVNAQNKPDSATARLDMYYFSAHVEYIFYQTKHWELSMPLQIGIGKTYYNLFVEGRKKRTDENTNFIYEPAVSIEYKYLKWIGLGADLGFRFMITQDRKLNLKFNSPIYTFKLLLYYNEIYKSIFPNRKFVKTV